MCATTFSQFKTNKSTELRLDRSCDPFSFPRFPSVHLLLLLFLPETDELLHPLHRIELVLQRSRRAHSKAQSSCDRQRVRQPKAHLTKGRGVGKAGAANQLAVVLIPAKKKHTATHLFRGQGHFGPVSFPNGATTEGFELFVIADIATVVCLTLMTSIAIQRIRSIPRVP